MQKTFKGIAHNSSRGTLYLLMINLVLWCLLVFIGDGHAVAEDVEHGVAHLPEPMVFDLVLPLGAEKGEFEANTLLLYRDFDNLTWAPEVEFAVLDGFALEFELVFEGSDLKAYKFAPQYTFELGSQDFFEHGTQAIVEYFRLDKFWEWTLLYIPGFRIDDTWSTLLMLGGRHTTGLDDEDLEAIINATLFADINERLLLAFETNLAAGGEEGTYLRLMPQLRYKFTDHFVIQCGAGVLSDRGETDLELAARIIFKN